jgi:Tol biopolymer transport system component
MRRGTTERVARTLRVLAPVVAVALLSSGCVWIRWVSRPVPGPGALGVYGRVAVSENGRYVAFAADRDARRPDVLLGVYRYDTIDDELVLVSVASDGTPADDWSGEPSISADGRYVAFSSDSEILVPGDENLATDVFVRDVVAGTTTRVSVSSAGVEADEDSYSPSISADGTRVAFTSDSDLLVATDQNLSSDVFVRNRVTNTTVIASVTAGGNQAEDGAWDGVISGNGRYVAWVTDSQLFTSDQNDADDVYRRDLQVNETLRVSRSRTANVLGGGGFAPAIDHSGRFVAFTSWGTDLAAGDTNGTADVFVRDMTLTESEIASRSNAGGQLTQPSGTATISADGTRVGFVTTAAAHPDDTNGGVADAYVRDRTAGRTRLVSTDSSGTQTGAPVTGLRLSGDGNYAAFATAGAYAGDDANGLRDVYLRFVTEPRPAGATPSVPRGQSRTVTITGTGFQAAATVTADQGITVSGVTVVNDATITATVSVPAGAPAGATGLTVKNPAPPGGPGFGADGSCTCLQVT